MYAVNTLTVAASNKPFHAGLREFEQLIRLFKGESPFNSQGTPHPAKQPLQLVASYTIERNCHAPAKNPHPNVVGQGQKENLRSQISVRKNPTTTHLPSSVQNWTPT